MKEVNLLKRWLDFRHMSQKELAEKMGVTQSFISYYVNKDDISYRKVTIRKFADAFGVDVDIFLKGPRVFIETEPIEMDGTDLTDENQIRIRLVNLIMALSDAELRHIHDLLSRYTVI